MIFGQPLTIGKRHFLSYAAELSASLQSLLGGHTPSGGGRPLLTGPEGEGTSTQPHAPLSRVRNVVEKNNSMRNKKPTLQCSYCNTCHRRVKF
jgi:hypothetical protein